MSLAALTHNSTSLYGIHCYAMMQYRHTHLSSLLYHVSWIRCWYWNWILLFASILLNTEIDVGDCHGFECLPRPWSLGRAGTRACIFHSTLLEANLNLDIGTNCRYIPSRQNQQPMNIKWWWNIGFNLLNFLLGSIVIQRIVCQVFDVQLLLSSGQPGTTVHRVHGGTLIIIMQ